MASLPPDPALLRSLAVSDTGFIFDPRTGYSYSTNATGLAVLTGLKDGLALPTIAERLAAELDGGVSIEDDVAQFVELCAQLGLVAP